MARLSASSILIFVLCGVALEGFAKPLETGAISEPSDENAYLVRRERSPQFSFGDYGDYSYSDVRSRHLKHKHKPKPSHGPINIQGGHQQGGCRSHGCGSYNKPNSGGGSFAGAFAGSNGGGNNHNTAAEAFNINVGNLMFSYAYAGSRDRQKYGDYGREFHEFAKQD
ncbi:uncharacterized protein LOC124405902 [Diprion similis]|uniref:uncharacterized protein LOC124405902 n=1 Tax=Diprion similis TaxID=362088 RepID=UPI001EF999EF|nr:uncharacterized protein LOC124405902 [Diprion similis]